MDHQSGNRESTSSFCTFQFLDCLSPASKDTPARLSVAPSVKRETNVLYQQPHLVEPMKLRVYEDLPSTPIVSEHSQLSQWGRNIASRASSRASRISVKRNTVLKSIVSKPQPVPEVITARTTRRRRDFTPLQLSIYVDENRLSDLPKFDRLSFTEVGEIKMPPKALVRTQSESMLRKHQDLTIESPKRTASMFEPSRIALTRPETSYSIVATSRPPSEYDALHSHPVSWASCPSTLVTKSSRAENVVAVMTPMQEEFSPIATTVTVGGTSLKFPKTVRPEPETTAAQSSASPESQAPYPVIRQGDLVTRPRTSSLRPYFHTNYQTQKRISQWLHYRSHSGSSSTLGSISTTTSFAEHRRKRSEFYKLSQTMEVPSPVAQDTQEPLDFSIPSPRSHHQRTNTESTSHTMATSVLSAIFEPAGKRHSQESMTTYTTATDVKSRTGTIKSFASPEGLRIYSPKVECTVSPKFSLDLVGRQDLYLEEIHGPLRSPGVGIAF